MSYLFIYFQKFNNFYTLATAGFGSGNNLRLKEEA
jgi:hypothetical protein